MKNTVVLIAINLLFCSLCYAQNKNKEPERIGNPNSSMHGLFIIKLSNGFDSFTREPIIRSFEVDSIIEIPRVKFLKEHSNVKAGAILRIKPKPNVKMVDINGIFEKFNIKESKRHLPITINGRKALDQKNICASLNAIKSVTVNEREKEINITVKPEK